jgi:electron transport complex protein RnfD
MAKFPELADSMSGATPLTAVKAALKEGHSLASGLSQISYSDFILGMKGGSFGEVSVIALLLGGLYLLIRRVITWHIPVAVLGSMALFTGILWAVDPAHQMSPVFHLLTGGAVLGALFMATDYVTSPMTWRGGLIFGAGIGVITILVRVWGTYPEGMSFAILIMNAFVPLIDRYVKPRRFGAVKRVKA